MASVKVPSVGSAYRLPEKLLSLTKPEGQSPTFRATAERNMCNRHEAQNDVKHGCCFNSG